jgi:hypothetical protein
MPAECRSEKCRAPIDFAVFIKADGTESPTPHPVDHGSAGQEGGRLAVWRNGDGVLCCRSLTKTDPELREGERLGTSHYGTCADPGRFRRAR